ncbi:MAG: ATP-binding protein [Desulfobacterales bacterium SG8_35]|nr:MAG: ATP-binding protein [Desulfobacterales bacterium SG8_35]
MTGRSQKSKIDSPRPFRLVKFFSFTGLGLVLITTMVLSWVISNYAKKVMLERSESYSLLLAEHVNRQVFLQFVLPTALRYGEIALRNPTQFKRLDTVVRNTTQGLKVDSVTIFDSKENIISYSTIAEEVGIRDAGGKEYKRALNGINSSLLTAKASLLNLLPGSDPISAKLMTYIPFRRENPLSERTEDIIGVTKVVQDLSDDMEAILRLQLTIIVVSILIMGTLFFILTQIVTKADQINEARAEERRRLEEKLHHAERLASLGEMVASVSHEIKNPLGIVRSTAEILNKRLKDQAPASKHLAEIIITETSRLDDIVREFLDFARPQVPQFTRENINDLLLKVEEFMQTEFTKNRISVENDLDPGLRPMHIDQNLLYRAFLNLFINAVQAMPDGGTLSISTSLSTEEKNKVVIMIKDTGVGIAEEKQAMIFTPFYTDKNRGTGLGLAIAKNIIDEHNGTIAVASETGKGATFIITLNRQ